MKRRVTERMRKRERGERERGERERAHMLIDNNGEHIFRVITSGQKVFHQTH